MFPQGEEAEDPNRIWSIKEWAFARMVTILKLVEGREHHICDGDIMDTTLMEALEEGEVAPRAVNMQAHRYANVEFGLDDRIKRYEANPEKYAMKPPSSNTRPRPEENSML